MLEQAERLRLLSWPRANAALKAGGCGVARPPSRLYVPLTPSPVLRFPTAIPESRVPNPGSRCPVPGARSDYFLDHRSAI